MSSRHALICACALFLLPSCAGEDGEAGQRGLQGERGFSTLFETSAIEPGDVCPNGGTLIAHGFDLDGDSLLSETEIRGSTTVCNGTDGSDGTDGRNGRSGADGEDSLSTLILLSEEPEGDQCLYGGQRIDAGQDVDSSGTLEAEEITQTTYVCDGADAVAVLVETSVEPVGPECPWAGVRIDSGRDEDGSGTLDAVEIQESQYVCNGHPSQYGVRVIQAPDPSTVFNNPDVCYVTLNTNSSCMWDDVSNRIYFGHGVLKGYWNISPWTSGWPTQPMVSAAESWGRMVIVPKPRRVIMSKNYEPRSLTDHFIADMSNQGVISNRQPVTSSDNFTYNCDVISNNQDEFLCFDRDNIRHYAVPETGSMLTLRKVVPLEIPVQDLTTLRGPHRGGTFAWDGIYYYMSNDDNASANTEYLVFRSNGSFEGRYNITGSGNITAPYFNWAMGRYSSHDGIGARQEGAVFTHTQPFILPDSHCFGAPSLYHMNSK